MQQTKVDAMEFAQFVEKNSPQTLATVGFVGVQEFFNNIILSELFKSYLVSKQSSIVIEQPFVENIVGREVKN